MSENGARTLFFLVYVSFTLIIIHNQWTSGLIYRFSFFRSSLFFSFGQHLCFLVFFTASHTYLHHIFSLHRDIFRFYECKLLRHHRSCCPPAASSPWSPPPTFLCVCHCAKMQIFPPDFGVRRAAPSPPRCTVQPSSRRSSSKCMYFVNSYFFLGFPFLILSTM